MKGQYIEKHVNKKKLSWKCKTDQKTRNYIMLSHVTKCPTEAEEIKYAQLSY